MQAEPAPQPLPPPGAPRDPFASPLDAATITARYAGALRDRRRARRWSQAHLAAAMRGLGFSWAQTTVAKIEAATRPVAIAEAAALAALLGATVDGMLGQDNDIELIAEVVWTRHRLARLEADAAAAALWLEAAREEYAAARAAYIGAHLGS